VSLTALTKRLQSHRAIPPEWNIDLLMTLNGEKMAWPVYLSICNLSKAKRRSVRTYGLILIGVLPKCPNGPRVHTNLFTYHESIAMRVRTVEEQAKSRIAVQCADGRTCHPFPRIASFLADHPEQYTITVAKPGSCPRCKICLHDRPGFACRLRCRHPQQYLHLSTTAAQEVGL